MFGTMPGGPSQIKVPRWLTTLLVIIGFVVGGFIAWNLPPPRESD